MYATVNPALSDFPADRVEGYLTDVQREAHNRLYKVYANLIRTQADT